MSEQVSRYHKGYWEPISHLVVFDCVWIDRKTGKIVMRYDAADPANTNPEYGAEPDWYLLDQKGIDIQEKIPVSECAVPPGKEHEHIYRLCGERY